VSVYGRYSFTNRKNRTLGNSVLTSNLGSFSIVSQEDKEINTDSRNHLMSWDIEAQLDDRNSLKISPNISYSSVDSRRASNGTIRRGLGSTITDQDYLAVDNLSTPNVDMDVLYSRAFHKPGRKFVVNMQGKYTQRDKIEDINDVSRNVNRITGEPVMGVDDYNLTQEVESDNQNRVGRLKASFVEPIDDNSILEFSYEYNYTAIDSRRSVWDADKQLFVDSLGVDYAYFFESNRVGLVYQMERSKRLKYTLGFAVQPLRLKGQTMDIDTFTQHSNVNLIPSAGLRFRINDESEWSIEYLGTNNQPNFSQIQPIRDVTNSQNIIVGNAELKAEFVNRITTRFRQIKLGKNRFFEAQLAFNQIQNKIVTNRSNPSS